MIKIFKYLKNSFLSILAIIAFLVVQAMCDLSLPDYTSKIVNVGIQQGGIENSAYTVIRESSLENILSLVSDDDKEYVLDKYKLIETKDSSKYKDKYPLIEEENLYLLDTKNKKEIEKLSDILEKPSLLLTALSSGESSIMPNMDLGDGVEFITLMKTLPSEQKEEILKNINNKIEEVPETLISSASIAAVKAEYELIGVDTEAIQTNYIIKTGLIMLSISLLTMIVSILIVLIGSRMAARLARTLREKVFVKVLSFSKTEMKNFGSSSLITRTTNDIQQVQGVIVFLLRVVFYAPIIGIGGVIKAMNTNISMTYIIAIALAAIILLVIILFAIALPKFKIIQKFVDKLNLVTREILTGLSVIRAFNNEKHEEERFNKANRDLTKINLFVNRVMSFMMPAMMFIMNLVCLLIVWQGAKGVDNGAMQVGDIMAYIQYTMQIIMAFLMISMISIMLPRASVSAKRIMEILETDEVIKNPKDQKEFDSNKKGIVEFKNVAFRYPDADYDVITDINFKAEPGKTTAFIGSTGSGKSTLINLIPRFYDVTKGSILIDGVNIKDVDIHKLRSKIGFVPQKGILFTGDIRSNISYGNENITEEEMKQAASISQAEEFILEFKEKYATPISQGGTNVSGGQKQRLSIARAIATNPDIYIFDDSFSALDFKTDAKLRGELKKVTKDKTVLIVAQRISTIMNADQIVVMDEGNVVGIGTHDELMKNCNVYKEIALSQLSKEELANE